MIAGIEIKKWVMWPWPRPFRGGLSYRLETFYLCAKFDDSSFSGSSDIIGTPSLKWVKWPWPRPFQRWFVICMLGLDIAYPCTKFDNSRFSRSRDMVGAHQNLNVSCNLSTSLSWIVCHLSGSTCCDRQPIYQIWSLYLYRLRRYERRGKIAKHWVVWSS